MAGADDRITAQDGWHGLMIGTRLHASGRYSTFIRWTW